MPTDVLNGKAHATKRDRQLTIGEFSRRCLLSPKALRIYDRQNLLVPAEVDPATGYRRYRESQLETARLISRLRQLDMPLATVARIVALPEAERADALASWWESIERRIAGQRDLLIYLLVGLAGKERNYDMFTIEERDIPAQFILTEQRHITVPHLQGWFDERMPAMHTIAERFGGITGPAFIIYHGEVNEESDGPVEICVPVDEARRDEIDVPTRVEPAHREAFTRINKSMVEFPQILTAYDAVEKWIESNGRECTGSPREVYFTDFMAAGPDDPACDIAFPIQSAD
jgi:DNA-binding transcriptional MerR regulator/effector-binding domain-containing protein